MPLAFYAIANFLLWSRDDVMMPLPTAHKLLDETHERIAGEYLQQVIPSPTRHRVRAIVTGRLSDGELTRAKVASAMAMSERTLRRRLEAEGTSFQQVLDDTRRELAEQYMSRGDLSLADIAYLLGFRDQSSLFRASTRWFGTSPSAPGTARLGAMATPLKTVPPLISGGSWLPKSAGRRRPESDNAAPRQDL